MKKFRFTITTLFIFSVNLFMYTYANDEHGSIEIYDIEALLDSVAIDSSAIDSSVIDSSVIDSLATIFNKETQILKEEAQGDQEPTSIKKPDADTTVIYVPINIEKTLIEIEKRIVKKKPYDINKRIYQSNPFFIDLVFKGYGDNQIQTTSLTQTITNNHTLQSENPAIFSSVIETKKQEKTLQNLRTASMRKMAVEDPHLIAFQVHKLPDISDLIDFKFSIPSIDRSIERFFSNKDIAHQKIAIEKVKYNPWIKKSNALLQLSESYVSSNWHQGGTNNTAILGILNATLNYNNKKYLQWENFFEWRLGFNTVDGDTLRTLNTNEDIMRAISKLGVRASGNWYYSSSVDFSTQLYKSYQGINSTNLKTNFLTPVRLNVSVGFDYKHKNIFSLMLSPLSYKFVYANDTVKIDQRSFGIPEGQRSINQIGSSFRAQLSYSPLRELDIDSRLNFFTNYEKIEVDWEIVGNLKINRYLSTRLSLNPRYDNTVLTDDKARLQFKQFLTIGFSYRLL